MPELIVVTVVADDRPGIVERVAGVIARHRGNWTESSMARLAGKFAGILLVEVAAEVKAAMVAELQSLAEAGIRVNIDDSSSPSVDTGALVQIEIVANDRPGIVGEISRLLASHAANLESLDTFCEPAPMTADLMFHAHAAVRLPNGMSRDDLVITLEQLSDDLMVEVVE